MKRGTQIAYIPLHADGNLKHPDVDFDFVTAEAGEMAHYCRYWSKQKGSGELRTKSFSELTYNHNLVEHVSCGQTFVDSQLEMLGYIERK